MYFLTSVCENSFSRGAPFSPFWFAKYLSFGGESYGIRILSGSIQETFTLRNQICLILWSKLVVILYTFRYLRVAKNKNKEEIQKVSIKMW